MPFLELQYREDDLARNRENRGRMAQSVAFATTTGSGTAELEDSVDFDALFIEKPIFNYGTEIDPDAVRDLLSLGPDDDVELPQATAHVTDWDVDENGHYSAAWIALTVTYPVTIPVETRVVMTWHLSFSGTGLKDVDPTG